MSIDEINNIYDKYKGDLEKSESYKKFADDKKMIEYFSKFKLLELNNFNNVSKKIDNLITVKYNDFIETSKTEEHKLQKVLLLKYYIYDILTKLMFENAYEPDKRKVNIEELYNKIDVFIEQNINKDDLMHQILKLQEKQIMSVADTKIQNSDPIVADPIVIEYLNQFIYNMKMLSENSSDLKIVSYCIDLLNYYKSGKIELTDDNLDEIKIIIYGVIFKKDSSNISHPKLIINKFHHIMCFKRKTKYYISKKLIELFTDEKFDKYFNKKKVKNV